jgi:filamentous hemagglutinin family protein
MTKQTNKQTARRLLSSILLSVFTATALALPSTDPTNLQTSAGVTVLQATNALTITAPNRAVLNWTNFGSGTDTISRSDLLTYQLPDAKSSVLNIVTGSAQSMIDGYISSNGKVYIINPNGIVIGANSRFDVASLALSASDNPVAAQLQYLRDGTVPSEVGIRSAFGSLTVNSSAMILSPNITLLAKNVYVGAAMFGGATTINADGDVQLGVQGGSTVFGGLTITNASGNTVLSMAGSTVNSTGPIVATSDRGNVLSQAGSRLVTKNLTVTSNYGAVNLGADGALITTATAPTVTIALDGLTPNPSVGGSSTGAFAVTSPASFKVDGVTGVSNSPFSFTSGGDLTLGAVHLDVTSATTFAGKTVTDTTNGIFVYGPVLFSATGGDISITKGNHSFGPVSVFANGNATVYEAAALNLNTVNVKNLVLKTGEYFFQTPTTASLLANSFNLTASGAVSLFTGNIASGLTISAGSSSVDLSRLSIATNLNGIAPTVTTTGAVGQPNP